MEVGAKKAPRNGTLWRSPDAQKCNDSEWFRCFFWRRNGIHLGYNSGASGDGLEVQNTRREASQGGGVEGGGSQNVQKPIVFVAFSHPPGLELWAHGHIHFGDGHVCPGMISLPLQNLCFFIGFRWSRATLQGARTPAEP